MRAKGQLPPVDQRDWLTAEEVAERMHVSVVCVRRWCAYGKPVRTGGGETRVFLGSHRIGRRRITKAALARFVELIETPTDSMDLPPTDAEIAARDAEDMRLARQMLGMD